MLMRLGLGVAGALALAVAAVGLGVLGTGSVAFASGNSNCSKASARPLVKKLRLADPSVADPVGKVLCGAFTGPGSQTMVVSLWGPGNSGWVTWAVFRWTGNAWEFLMKQPSASSITAAGPDIRQTLPIYRPSDPRCCPTGGTKSRIWHWNGKRFSASPWKQATKGEPEARGFDSPSLNISCGMFDGGGYHYVVCQSGRPPQKVTMDVAGQLTICRDPTPSDFNNDCNLGDRGDGPIQRLAYGKQIIVGRFRCQSLQIGVRCTVIQSGKGFLISRDGVRRVGP
jgi:hypothetical protein